MMGYIKAQSLVFLQKIIFQMQVEIANFVCTEEKKSFSLQFSTIVCAHEEWQLFEQFLNIPKESLFTILEKPKNIFSNDGAPIPCPSGSILKAL